MARNDIRLIIDAERKSADEKIQQLKKQHELEIQELEREYREYERRRAIYDWVWTGLSIGFCVFVVTLAVLS